MSKAVKEPVAEFNINQGAIRHAITPFIVHLMNSMSGSKAEFDKFLSQGQATPVVTTQATFDYFQKQMNERAERILGKKTLGETPMATVEACFKVWPNEATGGAGRQARSEAAAVRKDFQTRLFAAKTKEEFDDVIKTWPAELNMPETLASLISYREAVTLRKSRKAEDKAARDAAKAAKASERTETKAKQPAPAPAAPTKGVKRPVVAKID